MIGNPTDREFTGMFQEKLIANCPVTVHDVQNANQIFCPDLAYLRGKTTRSVCVLTWAPAREDLFAILGTFKSRCMDPPCLAS
jgi:hypothetical protein